MNLIPLRYFRCCYLVYCDRKLLDKVDFMPAKPNETRRVIQLAKIIGCPTRLTSGVFLPFVLIRYFA